MTAVDERGAVSTEFAVVMAAFLTSFMLLIVFAGRFVSAENDVRSAAHEAARAASLAGNPATANAAAGATADRNLASSGLSCAAGRRVDVDTTNFTPGGSVTVTISCVTPFSDLATVAVGGSHTFTSTAVEIIDTYRASP